MTCIYEKKSGIEGTKVINVINVAKHKMISARLTLAVTFLLHCLQPQVFAVVIRGLDRSLVHLYDPAKDFTCLDGKLIFMLSSKTLCTVVSYKSENFA